MVTQKRVSQIPSVQIHRRIAGGDMDMNKRRGKKQSIDF